MGEVSKKILQFVAHISSQDKFPNASKTWTPFRREQAESARAAGIALPSLKEWNIIRKSRLYDVFNDLGEAKKWWVDARLEYNLLGSTVPAQESIISASRAVLICPRQV